ncbi:MAG TPA: hypothetical protein VGI98_06990 [Candidatus Limnocylindrales bacterium]|jgi:hypothetical protein
MSFLERAKQAAEQARQVATDAAVQAKAATLEVTDRTQATLRDPATKEKARQTLHMAKRGISTAVERIDPAVLADIVIKATLLQEKANAALRAKGSPYRISEIAIGAAIPPSITFSIGRLDDPDDDPALKPGAPAPSVDPAGTVTTLDGTTLDEHDLQELIE